MRQTDGEDGTFGTWETGGKKPAQPRGKGGRCGTGKKEELGVRPHTLRLQNAVEGKSLILPQGGKTKEPTADE